ncbi:DUF1704 domain-containing protein [Candidatus Woesearchaeota archaeon]|nr:DUF1704 domain-containing protein [Candidatus Woesearchaeota archaeon]
MNENKEGDKNIALFEDLLSRIDKKLPFLGMNPRNEASEKKKFFKQKDYNPVFKYRRSASCDKLFHKIDEIELPSGVMSKLLLQRLEKFKRTNAMVQNIGKSEFTYFSKGIFDKPSAELVSKAYEILKAEQQKEENNHITAKKVVKEMKKMLAKLNLKDWKVGFKNMAANAAVITSKKSVYVKKKAKFSEDFLKRILVHEIGTHVFRALNGEKQPYKLFFTGTPNYMGTEEGLAVNIEAMHNCLPTNTLRTYAGRALAVNLALQKGFRDVFNELKKFFTDDVAWKLTLRAKRGLVDTSKSGAYTKDYLYLEGYYKVKKFLEEKGSEGLKQLYYGRIDIEQVPLLNQLEGLVEPQFLPDSESFRELVKQISV